MQCRFEGTEVFIRRDPHTGDVPARLPGNLPIEDWTAIGQESMFFGR